jgi:hypothetical protein
MHGPKSVHLSGSGQWTINVFKHILQTFATKWTFPSLTVVLIPISTHPTEHTYRFLYSHILIQYSSLAHLFVIHFSFICTKNSQIRYVVSGYTICQSMNADWHPRVSTNYRKLLTELYCSLISIDLVTLQHVRMLQKRILMQYTLSLNVQYSRQNVYSQNVLAHQCLFCEYTFFDSTHREYMDVW